MSVGNPVPTMPLAPHTHDPLRVAVAEDGGLFRAGLQMLLEALGHHVVAAVEDGDRLLSVMQEHPIDIAVLDIRMPPGPDGGLTTARTIRQRHPDVGLLLLSHYAEAHYLLKVLQIGTAAVGYRLKDHITSVEALHDSLVRVRRGEIVIEPAVAGRLVAEPTHREELSTLTERELNVLQLMAEGRSNAGIAAALYFSPKVVEKAVASIFAKLGLPPESASLNRRVLAVLTYLQAQPYAS